MIEKLTKKLDLIEPLVDALNNDELTTLYRFLCDRIQNPDFYAVFLGETSSGKSSIINGLLGKTVLPVDARPTTGVVTEIDINSTDDKLFAIDRQACCEEISMEQFRQFSVKPSKDLLKLVVHKNVPNNCLKGIHLFDTPGYGAIVREHEEVLKEFLPNADLVVYVVNYAVGIQNDDFYFLRSIKELLRDDTQFVLVVNMCPPSVPTADRRIVEIRTTASNLLGSDTELFIANRITLDKASTEHALPKCEDLWRCIANMLNSPSRQQRQYELFDSFIMDFFERCYDEADNRYNASTLDDETMQMLADEQEALAAKIEGAIDTLVKPAFAELISNLPQKIEETKNAAYKAIDKEIEAKPQSANQQQVINFTTEHLLPHHVEHQSKEIVTYYIETKLDNLNQQVEDLINKGTIELQKNINVNTNPNVVKATRQIASNISKKVIDSGLRNYFSAFGGAAGAGGGIANAASHALKKIGDLIGHKFTLATHNALKHTLSKIGFTSSKVLGGTAVVLTELIFIAWDFATWKHSLRKDVSKALDQWSKDTLPPVEEDLRKLELKNCQTISECAGIIRAEITYPDGKTSAALQKDVALADQIRVELTKLK